MIEERNGDETPEERVMSPWFKSKEMAIPVSSSHSGTSVKDAYSNEYRSSSLLTIGVPDKAHLR